MGTRADSLNDEQIGFIHAQHVFFVGTAAHDGTVNISPKGADSLRVIDPNSILWLNLTGSGNETAAHLRETNRITLMWCAFEGAPRILRAYGTARTVHPHEAGWQDCAQVIPAVGGARQYLRVSIDLVQTSCGFGVPLMDFRADRDTLARWAETKGDAGVRDYWDQKNRVSLDGRPTGIFGD